MISDRVYEQSAVAAFSLTSAPMGELSNFNPKFPITVLTDAGPVRLDSTETWYQVDKFRDHPEIQQGLIDAAWAHKNPPRGGKDFAWAHADKVSEDWAKGRSVQSMRFAIRIKTAQHRDAVTSALALADGRPIVEFSKKDAFWGAKPYPDGTLRGVNALGRLWMELGLELDKNPDAYKFVVPCYGTKLLGSPVRGWVREAQILNAHAVGTQVPGAVYVGRISKTDTGPWGNPVKVSEETPRGQAVLGYLDYLRENPQVLEAARRELAGRDLICWCAPRPCHGGVLAHVAAGNPVPETWPLAQPAPADSSPRENDAQSSFGF